MIAPGWIEIAEGPIRWAGLGWWYVPDTRIEQDPEFAYVEVYSKRLKRRVTIRLDSPTVEYFKGLAEETGIPYQTLINLYLRDCAESKKELNLEWRPEKAGAR